VIERPGFPEAGTITLRLGEGLFDRWLAHMSHWSDGVSVFPGTWEIVVDDPVIATVGGIPMEPDEEVTVALAFETSQDGEFGVDLYELIDGLTVGGVGYRWLFTDDEPPEVLDHSPPAGAAGVALNAPLVLTFSEEISPLTLNLDLVPAVAGWQADWNPAGTVVTVSHALFEPTTVYSVEVTARDAHANDMAAPLTWTFTTGTELGGEIFADSFEGQ
jgi:hypothetical protein